MRQGNVFKLTWVDMIRCRSQILFMLVFALITLFLSRNVSFLFSLSYMFFGAIIMSTQPFMNEQVSESGFINMLPCSKKERVIGRYLYGVALILFAGILTTGSFTVFQMSSGKEILLDWSRLLVIFFGLSLLVLGLQYTLFYVIGKIRNQQFATFVMMTPGFIMFFGSVYFGEHIGEFSSAVNWITEHMELAILLFLGFSLIVFSICIGICCKIAEKRDFA